MLTESADWVAMTHASSQVVMEDITPRAGSIVPSPNQKMAHRMESVRLGSVDETMKEIRMVAEMEWRDKFAGSHFLLPPQTAYHHSVAQCNTLRVEHVSATMLGQRSPHLFLDA
ncbi:hypothetical protein QPK87_19745 [Kamptonema cortianum]|nr:hypothetical protein [Kamptonema cortianum]